MGDFLQHFRENPVRYPASLAKTIIKEYWDIIPAVLGPIALNDAGNEIFGSLRFPVMIGGPLLSGVVGAMYSDDRKNRNMSACCASLASSLAVMAAPYSHLSAEDKTAGQAILAAGTAVMAYATYICDVSRIKNLQSSPGLEGKLQ
ncbi:MAG: hypothetical protein VE99_C0005G0031 [candidate division Kazan bacterium GW2011_GWC1_52_13]|nr:MAG: hypothetical protein VE99_C0005G0031 [candidate division Kazan bacterium GW2011_GWC1_52_13]